MMTAAIVAGGSWEDAGKLANIAGGLEVEKFGCLPISREEVIADLRIESGGAGLKIRTVEELVPELELRRARGETIVFTNGCYDILHAGHVRFLERCREFGHVTVVGLNSDASVRAQNKGTDRPVIPEDQRARILAALQSVDYVVLYDEATPLKLIERLYPEVLVKGEDWVERGVVGREHVESRGGRVVLLPLESGLSTTAIIERIRRGATT
jgi:D-beta-D-heptose 7-phosphate kinase/D-beta-D-heptose 1-phosphate adenosyltransferase